MILGGRLFAWFRLLSELLEFPFFILLLILRLSFNARSLVTLESPGLRINIPCPKPHDLPR